MRHVLPLTVVLVVATILGACRTDPGTGSGGTPPGTGVTDPPVPPPPVPGEPATVMGRICALGRDIATTVHLPPNGDPDAATVAAARVLRDRAAALAARFPADPDAATYLPLLAEARDARLATRAGLASFLDAAALILEAPACR